MTTWQPHDEHGPLTSQSDLPETAALGGAAAARGGATAASAAAAAPGPFPDPPLDVAHATPQLARVAVGYFQQKQARDIAGFLSFFSRRQMFYSDALTGRQWRSWPAWQAAVAGFDADWPPTIHTYPVKVVGDTRSGVVFFYNSPEMFGHEHRVMSAWDFRDEKINRQVDYWDGRHFTVAGTQQRKQTRVGPFPAEFGENDVPEQASAVLKQVTGSLSSALAAGDAAAAAAMFTSDATFQDLTLHTTMVGLQAIGGFLDRAVALLPYGPGTSVRHVVGTAQGGGYEWKNPGATVPNGIIELELDPQARISGLTTVWDGSLVTDPALTTMLQATIEH
jgi:hypothetical protein